MTSHSVENSLESWANKFGGTAVLGFLCTLLIVGKFIHHAFQLRGLFFGYLVVPPPILSGIIGLIWFAIINSLDPTIIARLSTGLRGLNSNLVNFVFAALILGLTCSKTSSQHSSIRGLFTSMLHEGMPMVIYSQILIWGQSACCLAAMCLTSYWFDIPHLFAAMVPLGIEAGEDVVVAPVFESDWSRLVLQEAESLGLIITCVLGILLISFEPILAARGWLGKAGSSNSRSGHTEYSGKVSSHAEAFEKAAGRRRANSSSTNGILRSYSAGNRLNELGTNNINSNISASGSGGNLYLSNSPTAARTNNSSFSFPEHSPSQTMYNGSKTDNEKINQASLGAHISLIALTVFLSFGLSLFVRLAELEAKINQHLFSGIQLFKLSMCCAYVSMHVIMRRRPTTVRFKKDWFMRLCGLMLDLLIISRLAVANPNAHSIGNTHYAICGSFVAVCVLWNAFCFVFVAKQMFPNFWFKRAVTLSADALGQAHSGLLFARTLDPTMESPVPAAFAYKLMMFFIPSSGVKNTIVVSLVQRQGAFPALLVTMSVVVAWLIIFQRYFKNRFVSESASSTSDSTVVEASASAPDMLSLTGSKKKHDERRRARTTSSDDGDMLELQNQPLLRNFLNERMHSSDDSSPMSGSGSNQKNLDTYEDPCGLELEESEEIARSQSKSTKCHSNQLEFADSSDCPVVAPGMNSGGAASRRQSARADNNNSNNNIGNTVDKIVVRTSEPSGMVSLDQLAVIARWLPPSKLFRKWNLQYSLRRDGACLETMMALCAGSNYGNHRSSSASSGGGGASRSFNRTSANSTVDGGVLLIEDSWGYVFGAYVGHALENKSVYYGNAESFVFSLTPKCQCFRWTGANDLFIVSNSSSLSMGGGGDGFAFHLDDELDTGVSNRSATYNNDQLSSSEFFKCLNVEYWSLSNLDEFV